MIGINSLIYKNRRRIVILIILLSGIASVVVLGARYIILSNKYKSEIVSYEQAIKSYNKEVQERDEIIAKYETDLEGMIATINDQAKQIDNLNNELREQEEATNSSEVYAIPDGHNTFKSYMPYTCLNRASKQWELVSQATSDENGLMKIGDYYCVAMGSYYTNTLGDKFTVTLDSGKVFKVIICDKKSDCHTDSNNMYTISNNCMMEFIIDNQTLLNEVKTHGDVSHAGFDGSIIKIEKEN